MAGKSKEGLPPLRIRYKGTFDYEGMYHYIISWMQSHGMWVYESPYKDKESGPGMVEIEATLKGKVKMDEYQSFEPKFMWKVFDCHKFEQDGKKLVHGRIDIVLMGSVVSDYQNIFDKTPWKAKFGQLLDSIIKKDTLRNQHEQWRKEMEGLHNSLKLFLGAESDNG